MRQESAQWVIVIAGTVVAAVVASVFWWIGQPPGSPDRPMSVPERQAGNRCPEVEGEYKPTLSADSGPTGSEVVASGPMPVHAEGGRYVGPTSRKVEVWWNLDPKEWPSAVSFRLPSPEPTPERDTAVHLLGIAHTFHRCFFELTFEVPDAPPGPYRIVALFYGRKSAAMFRPMSFSVAAD